MAAQDLIKLIVDRISATAKVENIYGEPKVIAGKTMVPVARIRYGFGAGAGEGLAKEGSEGGPRPGGAGGGGGVDVSPMGFIIADETAIRFVAIPRFRRFMALGMFCFILGFILGRAAGRSGRAEGR